MFLDKFLPDFTALKMEIANPDKPYKLARLVDYSGDLKRDWYIEFSVWHEGKNAIERKKVSAGINKHKTERARRAQAQLIINEIDKALKLGKVIKTETVPDPVPKFDIKKTTLIQAIDRHIENNKNSLSAATLKDYRTLKNTLNAWLVLKGIEEIKVLDFSLELSNMFFIYLKNEKVVLKGKEGVNKTIGVSNKTFNNYHTNLNAVFNSLHREEFIKKKQNPLRKITKKKSKGGNHVPFTKEQTTKIENLIIQKKEFQLLLFIKFIYYLFIRPGRELRLMQVKDIRENTVFVPSNRAKTEGRHISIPDDLEKIIQEKGLRNYPPDHYIFSLNGGPGPKPVNKLYFYNRHVTVLEELGFADKQYTLYGYKHTGNINYYLATKDIKAVQEQNGHTTSKQTEDYLRNLGLLRNEEMIKKFPSFSQAQNEETL